ncbi:hypothetical protein [Microbacterium album]|uniref:ATP/GTP-binding protein n=1 Tax=Microbacterium album TaxID=2053191 RepID=A0A917ICS7_9MICO|nr:hypothetical protein [Microbacterium album]GGH39340.1 hypothetical protein GCM10010921_10490 [Microbacterium album]
MPRSRRPRREDRDDGSLERLIAGWRRTETRRGREYSVQPVSGARAEKSYTCPGCRGTIEPGRAHVVVWSEDGVLGPAADLAARRHWHTHCWKTS